MTKEIRIVHYWGGVPIVATSKWHRSVKLVEKCAENGWSNWLVLSKKPENIALIEPFIEAGCKIVYLPRSKGNFDFGSVYRSFKLLSKIKCHVFHCHNDHTSPIIGAFFARTSVRVWSKLSMSDAYEQGITIHGLKRLMPSTRLTCWLANRVLAISDATKQEVCNQIGLEDKIVVVNAPVPIEKFIKATGAGIREEFNLRDCDTVITAVGHFAEVKGWDIAIKAFAKVNKKIVNTKLLLVGKKTSLPFYDKICALITQLNLQEHVIFAGNRSDIPEILKASDLFVFPSRSEGAGAALIEAMATGLPCIATNTGGIPGIIDNGKNGFLFQRENSDELAEKVIQVLATPELQAQLIETAQQGLQRFTIETYVESVFFHYQELLKNKKI